MKVEFDASMISSTIELTRIPALDRPIMHFVVEIQRFICDHATPSNYDPKALLCMHAYGISAYHAIPRNQLNAPGRSRSR